MIRVLLVCLIVVSMGYFSMQGVEGKSLATMHGGTITKVLQGTNTSASEVKRVRDNQGVSQKQVSATVVNKENYPMIRVLIQSGTTFSIAPDVQDKEISILVDGKVVCTYPKGTVLTATRKNQDVYLNGKKVGPRLTIEGDNHLFMMVNGRAYRGSIYLTTALSSTYIGVINVVGLEEYLYGVVPEEAVPSWKMPALEAQAVAARTYAYYEMQRRASYQYDVESDTRSQVYKGASSEYGSTTKAVQHTKGLILTYHGKPISAFFHSDSGGYTEDSENIWGNKIPYLRAVADPVKEVNPSTYKWTVVTDAKQIETILKQAGKEVGTLKEIKLSPLTKRPIVASDRGPSGRILRMEIVGSKGSVMVTGLEMQGYLGLKSTLFDIYVDGIPPTDVDTARPSKVFHTFKGKNPKVIIQGYGWGHGLGLSQWGAQGMAKHANADDTDFFKTILFHYYRNVKLEKLY